ncbi:hypothetical protein PV04_07582 [Phialophora macrospora]|uniref:DNA mismatch repair protein S5 domain-containing protein n=1 Tax=Phialophora macrospora TaxID=1851006 RepID=A0A0D2CJ92_9EURO|nr:hypothetical protein PV04_07582 [Phialophora macrospora]
MPIAALPEDTTRTLGSSLVLNDAKSVVKELIDNALDAQATAISIEISANTLDIIQVKDNGTGINVQDRQLLCKRGCTSKIRTIDDLGRLGGAFLGFRGEALASIVELSQCVIITSRVDGEVVGTSIKYAASGLISSSSASHPVGTTIRVQDFLMKIPVRKQSALKAPTKTLEAIKSLLFSFAFARPEVRFSLKVLKAKNDKLNWTYTATPNHSLAEVATKIVGKAIASACVAHTITSTDCDATPDADWGISAILISASVDPAKIRNTTQYISIDGRPVSAERRTMKEITKSYKRHVERSVFSSAGAPVQRPFLCMQIRCPPESYDVNVEPAKDDVLFLDFRSVQLLSLAESLFRQAYPIPSNHEEGRDSSANDQNTASPSGTSIFDKNMLRSNLADTDEMDAVDSEAARESIGPDETTLRGSNLRNPFIIAAMNAKVNPVKMVDKQIGRSSSGRISVTSGIQDEGHLPSARSGDCSLGEKPETYPLHNAHPTPFTSPRPGPPMRRRTKATTEIDDEPEWSRTCHGNSPGASPRHTGLQSWLTPNTGSPHLIRLRGESSNIQSPSSSAETTTLAPDVMTAAYNGIASSPQIGRRLGTGQKPFKIPSICRSQGQVSGGLPPSPPSSLYDRHGLFLQVESQNLSIDAEPDGQDNMSLPSSQQLRLKRSTVGSADHPLSKQSRHNSELNDIMDFEYRKKAAIAHQRRLEATSLSTPFRNTLSGSSRPEIVVALAGTVEKESTIEDYRSKFGSREDGSSKQQTSNPHRNRHQKATKDLSHSHPDGESETLLDPDLAINARAAVADRPVLSPNDPRAFLMKERSKPLQSKLHRTKLSKLPLESLSPGTETFGLKLVMNIFDSLQDIRERVQTLSLIDPYMKHGKVECTDFDSTDALTLKDWQYSFGNLVIERYPLQTQEERDMIGNMKFTISNSSCRSGKS